MRSKNINESLQPSYFTSTEQNRNDNADLRFLYWYGLVALMNTAKHGSRSGSTLESNNGDYKVLAKPTRWRQIW